MSGERPFKKPMFRVKRASCGRIIDNYGYRRYTCASKKETANERTL